MVILRCDRCDKAVLEMVRLTPTYVFTTPRPEKEPEKRDLCFDCYNGFGRYCNEDRERRQGEAPTFDRT